MSNSLTLPIYASKPQRKVPGLPGVVAVTMYRSQDKSVQEVALFTADGEAFLGMAYYQPPRRYRTRGWTMKSSPSINDETWRTLAEFAQAMAARLGVDL